MSVCLLPEKVAEFRKALKNKEIKIADLLDMTTEERTAILKEYAGDNAKEVNTLFEEKLVLKNRIQGIKNWASKMSESGKYSPMAKELLDKTLSEYRSKQQERVFSPAEHEAFLNDLADKRVGAHIDKATAQKVFELSSKVQELKDQPTTSLSGVSDEYLKAKQELNSFIESQKPVSNGQAIARNLAVFGRNSLLLNPSTPLKAMEGQFVTSAIESLVRRSSAGTFSQTNPDLVSRAATEAWDTFRKTGNNTAAMEGLNDTHILGKGEKFSSPTQGGSLSGVAKVIGKAAQLSTKAAIDLTHVTPFTKFYQKTFFDAADFASASIAKGEGLTGDALKTRAAEVFQDATRIEPKTQEGAMVRQMAQESSARITATNDTVLSRFALMSKNVLNKIIPGFPLGDLIMPIAKIPANIIANGIDNAGVGLPKGVYDIIKGRELMASTDLQTKYQGMSQFAAGMQRVMRIGGTVGTALLIASQLKKSDFKQDNYGNNFVKIGNLWINMEYIAAISPALAGAMTAKQKGGTLGNNIYEYGAGSVAGLKSTPGVDEVSSLLSQGLKRYASNFFTSRAVPTFLQNLSKDRPINRLFFGAHGVESTSQVNGDNSADWSRNPGKELEAFQAKVGDQTFKKANDTYNQKFQTWLDSMDKNSRFQSLSDEEKQKVITSKKADLKSAVMLQYGFKYKTVKSKPLPKF